MSQSGEIHVTHTENIIAVELPASSLTEEHLDATRHKLFRLAEGLGAAELRVDFAKITAIGSSALGMLLTLHRRATKAGGHLALCGLAPHLQQLLRLIRLDTIPDVRKGQS